MRGFSSLVIVILIALMGYSATAYKAPEIQADIDRRTEQGISDISLSNPVRVDTDGRHVTLRGFAQNEEEKQRILHAARDTWGALGPVDEIVILEKVSPYRLSASKSSNGAIVLTGYAPSEVERNVVVRQASDIFGAGRIKNEIKLAAGLPPGDWLRAIVSGFSGLAILDEGRVEFIDNALRLSGVAADQTVVDQVASFEAETPDGFTWSDDLRVLRPTVLPFTLNVVKDADGWEISGYAPDQEARAGLLSAAREAAGNTPVSGDLQLADGVTSTSWPLRVRQGIDALGELETGRLYVSDETIRLEGAVKAEKLAALRSATNNRPDWETDLVVLRPTIRPYVLDLVKTKDGDWTLRGVVNSEADRDALIEAVSELAGEGTIDAKLQLADGMPGADWSVFVRDRLKALETVESGSLGFSDYNVTLKGVVATPEARLSANEQVAEIDPKISTDLDELDKRLLASFSLTLSPEDGVRIGGVLPTGLTSQEAVDALGLKGGYEGEFSENGRGDADIWRRDMTVIGEYLPEFEAVDISLKSGRAAIAGETFEKSDTEQVLRKLTEALDSNWRPEFAIKTTDRRYADGTRRTNPLSGQKEEYRRGFWLPVVTNSAGLDTCRNRTAIILASNKITFLTNQNRLDARARRIINDLSAIAIGCLQDTGLALEIGGHTDSRGAARFNQRLSEARAQAVLEALVARGVDEDVLNAVGYGEKEPIASNATRKGRSANRRISFKWLDAIDDDL
ncbi:MAG: OmpA family protein [Hyphomicrobiales bacterium]|nr:OmpA family protein [Hyphomicrobiales bacterium]